MRIAVFLSVAVFAFYSNNHVYSQEAKIEEIELYAGIKGKVYYNETFFINEKNAPVIINRVKAKHIPAATAGTAKAVWDQAYKYLGDAKKKRLRQLSREQLEVTIDAKGTDAVAVKFGVIAYDAFKEYLGGLTAVTMSPPTDDMRWDFNPAYLFKIEKYGVVGVFVRQARMKDGSIWNFNVSKIQKEFSSRFTKITEKQILQTD